MPDNSRSVLIKRRKTLLFLSKQKNSIDFVYARIYDRILERCVPICFSGKDYQAKYAIRNRETAAILLLNVNND